MFEKQISLWNNQNPILKLVIKLNLGFKLII
jgi:hypothetical protein